MNVTKDYSDNTRFFKSIVASRLNLLTHLQLLSSAILLSLIPSLAYADVADFDEVEDLADDDWVSNQLSNWQDLSGALHSHHTYMTLTDVLLIILTCISLLAVALYLHFALRRTLAKTSCSLIEKERETAKLALVARHTTNAVIFADRSGRIEWVNDGFTKITEYTLDEVRGKKPGSFLSGPETDLDSSRLMREAVRDGKPSEVEIINYSKTGRRYWLFIQIQPIVDSKGTCTGFMAIESDITVRKTAQLQVLAERDYTSKIIEGTPALIVGVGLDGMTTFINPAVTAVTGYSADELIGKNWWKILYPGEQYQQIERLFIDLKNKVDVRNRESTMTVKSGALATISWNSINRYNVDGTLAEIIGFGHDVTNLRHLTNQLVIAKDAAEAANKAKSEFLANTSHEIRTPMNGILGMTELLLGEELTSEFREQLGIIQESAVSLLTIVNDILDLAKVETGKFELSIAPFSLAATARNCTNLLGARIRQRKVSFLPRVAANVPKLLLGDEQRLRQVLINLLGNSVKFTPPGGTIELIIDAEFLGQSRWKMTFTVSDTGIGIPAEKLKDVFSSFVQADPSYTRRFGGTGLGLSISQQLVNMMGGEINVSSVEGSGSTFSFSIELQESNGVTEHPAVKTHTLQNIPAMQILVVEDNPTNRKIVTKHLQRRGHTVVEAESGIEALQQFDKQKFDLILMDCQMPEMDGFETTSRLREDPRGKSIPIVALTAHAMAGDRERCISFGMNDYLSKPLLVDELERVLYTWSSSRAPHAT